MKPLKTVLISFILFAVITCDHGIEPSAGSSSITGISGTIVFENWPPADSIKLLKLVVFYNFPPKNILSEVLNDSAFAYPTALTETLPYAADSIHYEMELNPGRYGYIVVAQQYGSDLFNDWRAVGQYDKTPTDSLPTAIFVEKGILKKNIDIMVDFNELPAQPF